MKFTPHPFQKLAIEHASSFLLSAQRGDKNLYDAPTGTGKSVIELFVQEATGAWIVTPREEIIDGLLDKLGVDGDWKAAFDRRICTPIRLRNRLLNGELEPPAALIFDEGHHHSAETWQQITLLCGMAPSVAFTATPFRGSPRSTREFLDFWGDPIHIISYPEAQHLGYISLPTFQMLPLVDDDEVAVVNGEFEVTGVTAAYSSRLAELAAYASRWWDGHDYDRPTIFSFPSSELCRQAQSLFAAAGLPLAVVSADTPRDTRRAIFDVAIARGVAIAHINIVTEGVDLPLRRLVDLAPTMSPVKWLQQLGRITRPTRDGTVPEYIATNRNLLRHAYLLEGCLPSSVVVKAESVFGPSDRSDTRVVGLEPIGRFKPTRVKLLSGGTATVWCMSAVSDHAVAEYAAIVRPHTAPMWAIKVSAIKPDGTRDWGHWQACEPPVDLRGFASVPMSEVSPKQQAWWSRSARHFGLDPDQSLNRKVFVALPILADLGVPLT